MELNDKIFNDEELAEFRLRELFMNNGYTRYKMNRFEEYDLYAHNKNFLSCDRMITFSAPDGKLLALKPDVTMSYVRHLYGKEQVNEKVFYAENVYRYSRKGKSFHEIRQVGIEKISSTSFIPTEEVILAAKTLNAIADNYVLDVSEYGYVVKILKAAGVDNQDYEEVMQIIIEKNQSALKSFCEIKSIKNFELLLTLITCFGKIEDVLPKIEEVCKKANIVYDFTLFESILEASKKAKLQDRIVIDFSIPCNADYYDGLLFKGFINKLTDPILSGGGYSKLAEKLGVKAQAIGFVVYLNELEYLK